MKVGFQEFGIDAQQRKLRWFKQLVDDRPGVEAGHERHHQQAVGDALSERPGGGELGIDMGAVEVGGERRQTA